MAVSPQANPRLPPPPSRIAIMSVLPVAPFALLIVIAFSVVRAAKVSAAPVDEDLFGLLPSPLPYPRQFPRKHSYSNDAVRQAMPSYDGNNSGGGSGSGSSGGTSTTAAPSSGGSTTAASTSGGGTTAAPSSGGSTTAAPSSGGGTTAAPSSGGSDANSGGSDASKNNGQQSNSGKSQGGNVSDSGGGLGAGVIAGIVAGAILIGAVAIAGFVFVRRKHSNIENNDSYYRFSGGPAAPTDHPRTRAAAAAAPSGGEPGASLPGSSVPISDGHLDDLNTSKSAVIHAPGTGRVPPIRDAPPVAGNSNGTTVAGVAALASNGAPRQQVTRTRSSDSVGSSESSETIVAPELGSTQSTQLPRHGDRTSTSAAAPWFQPPGIAGQVHGIHQSTESDYHRW